MVDWKLYIDSPQKRALDSCRGFLTEDDGFGGGLGYGYGYDAGWGDGGGRRPADGDGRSAKVW